MLKLFGKQTVEYPNARDFERKKYTRFEASRHRLHRGDFETPQPVERMLDDQKGVRHTTKRVDLDLVSEKTARPVSVPDDAHADEEISPSVLRAALPMRFAAIDASQGLASIHDAFNTERG